MEEFVEALAGFVLGYNEFSHGNSFICSVDFRLLEALDMEAAS
jgi:hypothetical protein